MAITKTPWHSWRSGTLSKGCALCVQGKKLVLFVTGKCPQRCFYCPINEAKFGKNAAYANEWKIADPTKPSELIEEARLTQACGAGITGGDPLADLPRTVRYITLLKKTFGKKFHIHLYTSLQLVTPKALAALHTAGLDEIRFHPNLDNDSLWHRLALAGEHDWDIGVEIPAIPGYEKRTQQLIDHIADKVHFLNLNELELSDTCVPHYRLNKMGFTAKDRISYGVRGSTQTALALTRYAEKKGLRVHACTAALKDGIQVQRRIERRAQHVALPFDDVTLDGTLVRGVAYVRGTAPGLEYKKRTAKPKTLLAILAAAQKTTQKIGITTVVDQEKLRLLMAKKDAIKNAGTLKRLGLQPGIIEEYPTADALQIDLRFL